MKNEESIDRSVQSKTTRGTSKENEGNVGSGILQERTVEINSESPVTSFMRGPKEVAAKDLLVYSNPKVGKSTIIAELTQKLGGKGLVVSLEKGGYDYLSGNIFDCYEDDKKTFNDAYGRYRYILKELEAGRVKADYLIFDTITSLDEWSLIAGTYTYMSTVQGKLFNTEKLADGSYRKNVDGSLFRYKHTDINWRYVTELGEGHGWRWPREWFMNQIKLFQSLAPYRIYVAHIKDKYTGKQGDDFITTHEVNLTGKLKSILTANVTSIAKLVPEGNKRYLSFETPDENTIMGSRAPLKGKILISEQMEDDSIKTYWENIYPNLKS